MRVFGIALAAALGLFSIGVQAQSLTVGTAYEPLSMDPQFTRANSNQVFSAHMFDRLVEPGPTGNTEPHLAESWENIDPTTWVVHLRQGVTFHDGSPFTAEDVVYSLERAPNVPNSPASFAAQVADVESMEIVDDHTIRFTTKRPSPMFIEDIGYIYILPSDASEGMTNEDFNSGVAAIGTGAYKFVSWTPGDRLQLVRNDDYWGTPPAYENVTIRFIANDAARIAALRSGSVDLIDQVPPVDVQSLEGNPDVKLYSAATYRIIYMALNQNDDAPLLTDLQGNPLPENPLQDARVRTAISLMIDRQAIVDALLFGGGEAANQFVNSRSFGYDPSLPAPEPDLERARELLAEAGYPDGFGITLHSSNDRFAQDAELVQVMGQMLARGGLRVNRVETLPYAVYARDAADNKYAAFTFSYGNATAESLRGLISSLHSNEPENDRGTLNRFGYSSAEFDTAINAAAQEFDVDQREAYLQQAATIAYEDTAFLPLYFQSIYWASGPNVEFDARADERTFAMRAQPVQ